MRKLAIVIIAVMVVGLAIQSYAKTVVPTVKFEFVSGNYDIKYSSFTACLLKIKPNLWKLFTYSIGVVPVLSPSHCYGMEIVKSNPYYFLFKYDSETAKMGAKIILNTSTVSSIPADLKKGEFVEHAVNKLPDVWEQKLQLPISLKNIEKAKIEKPAIPALPKPGK